MRQRGIMHGHLPSVPACAGIFSETRMAIRIPGQAWYIRAAILAERTEQKQTDVLSWSCYAQSGKLHKRHGGVFFRLPEPYGIIRPGECFVQDADEQREFKCFSGLLSLSPQLKFGWS